MKKRYQVFVSSTYADLKNERQKVIQALMRMACIPAGMELFPAANEEQWNFIQRVIDDCDYYVLIIGGRYGSLSESGISYTEMEFEYAVERGLDVLAFVHQSPDDIPSGKTEHDPQLREKLDNFRERIKKNRLVEFWKTADELPGLVALSLFETIRSRPAIGWVRGTESGTNTIDKVVSNIEEVFHEKERLNYIDRVLAAGSFCQPLGAHVTHCRNANDKEIVCRRIHGATPEIRRETYLRCLSEFIRATHKCYFTLQPGLGWFFGNSWFLGEFSEDISASRVVIEEDGDKLVEQGQNNDLLEMYAYDTGNQIETLWFTQKNARKKLEKWRRQFSTSLKPIDLDAVADGVGDLAICDNRVVMQYIDSTSGSGEGRFIAYLAEAKEISDVQELVRQLSPASPKTFDNAKAAEDYNAQTDPVKLQALEMAANRFSELPLRQRQCHLSLDIVRENVQLLKQELCRGVTIGRRNSIRWVLKSDAYGLGLKRISRLLYEAGETKFAVSRLKEAQKLRSALMHFEGHQKLDIDILVTEPIQRAQLHALVQQNIACFAWMTSQIDELQDLVRTRCAKEHRVRLYLKIDVEMRRLGLELGQLEALVRHVLNCDRIKLCGISAHFPASHGDENFDVEAAQFAIQSSVSELRSVLGDQWPDHVSLQTRSTGSLPLASSHDSDFPIEYRIGGALFGVFPSSTCRDITIEQLRLRPAIELRGKIESVRRVLRGQEVSYRGASWKADEDTLIGWLNLGYNEGLPIIRKDDNRLGKVRIRGVECELLVTNSQNMAVVRLKEKLLSKNAVMQLDAEHGIATGLNDPVILFSRTGELPIEELAESLQVPTYRLLTNMKKVGIRAS